MSVFNIGRYDQARRIRLGAPDLIQPLATQPHYLMHHFIVTQ